MDRKVEQFYEVLYSRRSVRNFQSKPLASSSLDRLLETLRRAQSAANAQPWHFYVIKNELRQAFNEVLNKKSFHTAPVIIAAQAFSENSWTRTADRQQYAWVDVTIALTEMIAAATAEGIGACWIASFDVVKAKQLLGLPESAELVALVALGYPDEPLEVHDKQRKALQDIITVR